MSTGDTIQTMFLNMVIILLLSLRTVLLSIEGAPPQFMINNKKILDYLMMQSEMGSDCLLFGYFIFRYDAVYRLTGYKLAVTQAKRQLRHSVILATIYRCLTEVSYAS
jgi:hypothetical protein